MTSRLYENMPFDNILSCVHCGLCLEACPTYRELGTEQDSPRGRLYLMRGLWEGELQPEPAVLAPLDRCIDCRACETACPSKVPYGELLEKTRGVTASHRPKSLKRELLTAFFLRRMLASSGWLVFLSKLGKLARITGLARLAGSGVVQKLLPSSLARGVALMPFFEGKSFKLTRAATAARVGSKGKVGLFTGCIMDVADHEVHRASVALLEAAGWEVVVPKEQTCCGALAVHAGERDKPRELAQRNHAAFGADLHTIIVNAAGCGAQLKEYAHLFAETAPEQASRWHAFGARTRDLLSFLAAQPLATDVSAWVDTPLEVFYDAPCHLMHAQGDDAAPRSLLANLPGVRLLPLCEADRCCGAGGVYNMVQAELSDKVLARKMDDIEHMLALHPGTEILLSANPGCHLQLSKGCSQRKLPLRVIHPAVLLAARLKATKH